ncbi:MAG: hypothetical protein WAT39_18545 [Planctomycetota bacterium]
MSSSRPVLRTRDTDHEPEADDYDDNWLSAGIDPLLHPGWETLRRLAADEHRRDFSPRDRLRLCAVARWLRRQLGRLGRRASGTTGRW